MAVTLTDQLVGQLVGGRYQVLSRIARGGMATVYLALDRLLERQVALKVMHPHLAEGLTGADFTARFRREAKSAARLAHPGLVAVFDQGTDGETSYLVMEYVEGTNLRRVLLEDGPLPVGDALQTVEAVLEALAVAHEAGVIHRDVKPENVLVAADGAIKVADFGLARAMAEASSTTTGTVLGSVAYLAPELVRFGESDERTDLYSVGILLYELLTGRQPFVGTTPLQIAYQHASADVPAPSATLEWLPQEVDELVATLSAREPDDRPGGANAALEVVRNTHAKLDPGLLSRRSGSLTRGALLRLGADGQALSGGLDPAKSALERPNGHLDEDAAAPAGPHRRRDRKRLLVSLITAAAAILGLVGWWYLTAGPGGYTTVPVGLRGAIVTDAEATLAEAGLMVNTVQVFHPSEAAGTVLTVSPSEGAEIRKDGTVEVTVSKGPDLRDVPPQSTGRPLEQVQVALAAAGFSVPPALHAYSDTVPAGTIISVTDADGDPVEFGAQLPVGTVIILTCSDGLEPVTIPSVVGLTRDAAITALTAAGLQVSESQAHSSDVAAGIVKAQSPAAGAEGHRTDTVSIVVSKGPQPPPAGTVRVPNLIGWYKYAAWGKIAELGFAGSHVDTHCTLGYDHCVVESMSPAPGTYQPYGSTITIYLRDE